MLNLDEKWVKLTFFGPYFAYKVVFFISRISTGKMRNILILEKRKVMGISSTKKKRFDVNPRVEN